MGVIPNGLAGVTPGPIQQATGVTGGEGISRLATLDQPTAESILKQLFVLDNASLDNPLQTIYSGLRQGISLPLAIAEALAKRLLGLPDDFMFFNMDHVKTALKKVPLLGDLAEALTGVEDGDLNDLGSWALGVRNSIQEIIDKIANAVFGGLLSGNPIEAVADAIGALLGGVRNAQSSANIANAGLAAVQATLAAADTDNPNALSGSDQFDRAAANDPGPMYDTIYIGSGGGTWETNGNGLLVWDQSGGQTRSAFAVRNDIAFDSDFQVLTVVITEKIRPEATVWLLPRCNDDATSTCWVAATDEAVQFGYIGGGTSTPLSPVIEYDRADGEIWEVWSGTSLTPPNDRRFIIRRNNLTLFEFTDVAAVTAMGSSNRRIAAGVTAGAGGFVQHAPPPFDAIAFADRKIA